MTPKEKAVDLLKKVTTSLTEQENKEDMLWGIAVHYQTIDIVLLMVDEIINQLPEWSTDYEVQASHRFFQQVKEEITVLASIP